MNFLHSGGAGDVIYALPYIRHLGGGTLYVKPCNPYNMVCNIYQAVVRLVACQPYMAGVIEHAIGYGFHTHAPGIKVDVDLDIFRRLAGLNTRPLPALYFEAAGLVPPLAATLAPWLAIPPVPHVGGALVCRTARYQDPRLDWAGVLAAARQRHGRVAFIGLPAEHVDFERLVGGPCPYLPTADLLEAAQAIAGADALYCNQGACLTVAQGMGKPYYLEVAPGHTNCILGGPGEKLLNR